MRGTSPSINSSTIWDTTVKQWIYIRITTIISLNFVSFVSFLWVTGSGISPSPCPNSLGRADGTTEGATQNLEIGHVALGSGNQAPRSQFRQRSCGFYLRSVVYHKPDNPLIIEHANIEKNMVNVRNMRENTIMEHTQKYILIERQKSQE